MLKKRPYRKIIYRKKVNILLVQIVNRNLGDSVIADNAEYLVRQALPRLSDRHYAVQRYDIQSEDYARVRAADMIIFDGGGLIKYKQEEFHTYVPALLDCAQEYGIPVFFNSVGVEGCDALDERCMRLVRTLNDTCVKGITVRDDLETLLCGYITKERQKQMHISAAADTAVFTPQVYGIHRRIKKTSACNTIGLGIVRWRIFEDYGLGQITRDFQLELWKQITQELEKRGFQWKFFVNGLRSDYDFAEEILAYMGKTAESAQFLVPRPAESRELAETIASFAGVIACRMHANIIAYALGIPSVGLVWNDKMIFWSERIGYPERFFQSDCFVPERIAECMAESIREGVRPCPKELKNSIYRPLAKFVRTYGRKALKEHRNVREQKPVDWTAHLAAAALGGLHMRYSGMNTPKGLACALDNGFRIFESDIRLTSDRRLVCVNGWSKSSYERLGADPQQYENGMEYDTFLKCRMYGKYETADAEWLLEQMRQVEGAWKLILDIGKPNKEMLAALTDILAKLLSKEAYPWEEHLFIRLQSKYDVETVRKAQLPVQMMYYVPPKQKREEKNQTLDAIGKYCRKQNIQWVSMPKEALDEEVMAYLRKEKLKTCVFSYNSYTDALQALELGADWIATSYLSPAQMADWYESSYTIVIR